MLVSMLRIKGDFDVRAVARKLGLPRSSYVLKGEPVKLGPRKGRKLRTSQLHMRLADNNNTPLHMDELSNSLVQLHPFLHELRAVSRKPLRLQLSVGIGVGGNKAFVRSVTLSAHLLSLLVTLGIELEFIGYPCSDET